MCGEYAVIDVQAEAHALPFEDSSQDYVISSHVFEHLPGKVIRAGRFLDADAAHHHLASLQR